MKSPPSPEPITYLANGNGLPAMESTNREFVTLVEQSIAIPKYDELL